MNATYHNPLSRGELRLALKISDCLVHDFRYLPSIPTLCQSRQNQFAPLFWSASYRNFTVIVQVGQLPRSWRGLRFSLGYGITRKTASRSSLPVFLPRLGCAGERIEICENSDSAKHANLCEQPAFSFASCLLLFPFWRFPASPCLSYRPPPTNHLSQQSRNTYSRI